MKFIVTAEHTAGRSVDHPCTRGVYSDPTNHFQITVEVNDLLDAISRGHTELETIVTDSNPCDCHRKRRPGGREWWDSVIVQCWPQDREALLAWELEGGDVNHDPLNLIPQSLKEQKETAMNDKPFLVINLADGEITTIKRRDSIDQAIDLGVELAVEQCDIPRGQVREALVDNNEFTALDIQIVIRQWEDE